MRVRLLAGGLALVAVAVMVVLPRAVEAWTTGIIRVNTTAAGVQADWDSWEPDVSGDGTWVAFVSNSSNLYPGPSTSIQVYAKNTSTDQLELVSISLSGGGGNGTSQYPAISRDGRYVVFASEASDLVPHDTNGVSDVFRRDLVTHTTELVSVANNGARTDRPSGLASISADGRFVAFESKAQNLPGGVTSGSVVPQQIYRRDVVVGTTTLMSRTATGGPANSDSAHPSISADGRWVAYASHATNIVLPDTNAGIRDVYVYNSLFNRTVRASLDNAGVQADRDSWYPAISGDGRYVAFQSRATNLGLPNPPSPGWQVYTRDLTAQTTDGISMDEHAVAGNGISYGPSISADGRYVAFNSWATNLVRNDTNGVADVFVRDRSANTTVLASLTETAGQANAGCETAITAYAGAITADGATVVFESTATNIVTPDTNGAHADVYLAPVPIVLRSASPSARNEPSPTRSG